MKVNTGFVLLSLVISLQPGWAQVAAFSGIVPAEAKNRFTSDDISQMNEIMNEIHLNYYQWQKIKPGESTVTYRVIRDKNGVKYWETSGTNSPLDSVLNQNFAKNVEMFRTLTKPGDTLYMSFAVDIENFSQEKVTGIPVSFPEKMEEVPEYLYLLSAKGDIPFSFTKSDKASGWEAVYNGKKYLFANDAPLKGKERPVVLEGSLKGIYAAGDSMFVVSGTRSYCQPAVLKIYLVSGGQSVPAAEIHLWGLPQQQDMADLGWQEEKTGEEQYLLLQDAGVRLSLVYARNDPNTLCAGYRKISPVGNVVLRVKKGMKILEATRVISDTHRYVMVLLEEGGEFPVYVAGWIPR